MQTGQVSSAKFVKIFETAKISSAKLTHFDLSKGKIYYFEL